ncbi:hypothetical protein ABT127_29770 [Streptomyces sp. NPDC001904]|uniref:hypothetical protein n=1 Tax=Streptomyces sp. NPDC001904 TaxID=3154531 RepID=UPI003332F5CE
MTDAPDAAPFPSDLLAAQKLLAELGAQLAAFAKERPWSLEPVEAISDTQGWRAMERPASPGWSDDDRAAYATLWEELRKTAALVGGHRYWAAFEGPDLVKRRMLLKHDPAALPTPVKPAQVDADAPAVEDLAQAV